MGLIAKEEGSWLAVQRFVDSSIGACDVASIEARLSATGHETQDEWSLSNFVFILLWHRVLRRFALLCETRYQQHARGRLARRKRRCHSNTDGAC